MMCVTTRFQLRRPWQLLSMYHSYRRMRHDLEAAPGLLRHAFLIQGPTVCCTLSVWESQEALDRFANISSHVAAVRGAKGICSEIWSAYWRLDAISKYANAWSGDHEWPELVSHPEQSWRLVEPTVAAAASQSTAGDSRALAASNVIAAGSGIRSWDWHGAERVRTQGD